MKPRRALLSVSDKTGIVDLARALVQQGVELLSTGGTASLLAREGLPVVEVADYTGFPEIMEGRVKTLHPRIHGGLLGRRDVDEAVMQDHGIGPIDLLVVNLYPFQRTVARPDCDLATAIEHIDVGGPAMIRAAAKNHAWVTVVVDPEDYAGLLEALRTGEGISSDTRFALAAKAFEHTARYDAAIANYLSAHGRVAAGEDFPPHLVLVYDKREDLRYGENPHQRAAFYARHHPPAGSAAAGRQLQGKPLSFNNIADADAALDCVSALEEPACVIVKHANPCGAALGASLTQAYERAYACDPTSAFGGIIAFNRPLDAATAECILGRQFVEVIAAPAVEADALVLLARKPDVRVLEVGQWSERVARELDLRSVTGGVLVQERDIARAPIAIEGLRIVSRRAPTDAEIRDLLFAWRVCACVKSNAIVYARDGQTVGIGAGQMSRVYSARIAAIKAADAGLELAGSVVASDAFFPFRDGVDTAAAAGARAVIQPGGSMRDAEVIAAADEHDLAMVFTGVRHFRH